MDKLYIASYISAHSKGQLYPTIKRRVQYDEESSMLAHLKESIINTQASNDRAPKPDECLLNIYELDVVTGKLKQLKPVMDESFTLSLQKVEVEEHALKEVD